MAATRTNESHSPVRFFLRILFLVLIAHSSLATSNGSQITTTTISHNLETSSLKLISDIEDRINNKTEIDESTGRKRDNKRVIRLASEHNNNNSDEEEAAVLVAGDSEESGGGAINSEQFGGGSLNRVSNRSHPNRNPAEVAAAPEQEAAGSHSQSEATAQTTTTGSGEPLDRVARVPAAQQPAPPPTPPPMATSAATVNYAELCYLSNGGSSITLTVNEATQVGSVIGTVEVNGDPSLEGGNVDLFDAPEVATGAQLMSSRLQQAGADQLTAATENNPNRRRLLGRRAATSMEEPEVGQSPSNRTARQVGATGSRHQPPPPPQQQQEQHGSFYSLLGSGFVPQATPPQPQQPAVRLEPGTRNLILIRALDKESAEGESGLVIQVRCSPRAEVARGLPDSPTTIPVRILVTDANDHAPEFLGPQPYVVNISETTPIGAVVSRDILARDRDSAGPHSTLHYRVLEEAGGNTATPLLQFANPLDPTLVVAGQLDYERLSSFTLTIVASDQGEPEPLTCSAQLQVNVIDFDDQNPRFLDDKYSVIMDETQQSMVGQNLQVLPRNLYAEDGDKGIGAQIQYSFDQLPATTSSGGSSPDSESSTSLPVALQTTLQPQTSTGSGSIDEPGANIERYLHLSPTSGEIRLIRQWPSKWLAAPVTLVVRATQADNKDRYTLTTLTVAPVRLSSSGQRISAAPANQRNSRNLTDSPETTTNQPSVNLQQAGGVEFAPDKLSIEVPENVPINEKIARVRARHLPSAGSQLQPPEVGADQPVDLMGSSNKTAASSGRRQRLAELQQAAAKRPINYQILDDQTDQFGINGLGEIFVKRALDYEQKQEYKFRVLATYTKYSDICQVHVQVINLNDNKPKAHDADLNDSIRYSLSGEHAHLFEVAPATGQLSLRPHIRQLNISSCQLIAQATDSIGPPPHHSHQARVNLHVAPQLVGRSLSLPPEGPAHRQSIPPQDPEAKLFNSRSLQSADGGGSGQQWTSQQQQRPTTATIRQEVGTTGSAASQRSSVATVMSSLQHMVRSVNLLDMPMSSALLLSALLAFLVCLLCIVLVSMSVHFYRRRSKWRHRNQLAAAARLRHAQLATGAPPAAGPPNYPAANSLQRHNPLHSPHLNQKGPSSNPNSSTSNYSLPGQNVHFQQPLTGTNHQQRPASVLMSPRATPTGRTGKPEVATATLMRSPLEALSAQLEACAQEASSRQQEQLSGSGGHRFTTSGGLAQNSLISSLSSSQSKGSYRSNTTDDSSVMHCGHYSVNASQSQPSPPGSGARTTTGGNSSLSPRARPTSGLGRRQVSGNELDSCDIGAELSVDLLPAAGVQTPSPPTAKHQYAETGRRKPPLSLAASARVAPQNELSVLTGGQPGIKSYRKLPHLGSMVRPQRNNRVGAAEQVARISYKLPALTSPPPPDGKLRRAEALDSAIASDASSASAGNNQQSLPEVRGVGNARSEVIAEGAGRAPDLNSLSPASDPSSSDCESPAPPPSMSTIRWPTGAIPQRVKKLTWDDELLTGERQSDQPETSQTTTTASNRRLPPLTSGGYQISPKPSSHLYPIEGASSDNEGDHYAEQHFLFSDNSPAATVTTAAPAASLLSTDFTSRYSTSAAAEVAQQQRNQQAAEVGDEEAQNNCFDYTIVQSSQFRMDSSLNLNSATSGHVQYQQPEAASSKPSLSAQHHNHLLQLQQQQQVKQRITSSYLYNACDNGDANDTSAATNNLFGSGSRRQPQDLSQLMSATMGSSATMAVL